MNKDLFINAVLQERAWEFFGEGDRWYDLTRTGKFLTEIPKVKNADYPERKPLAKHRYFPIPQVEINANPKLQQNPDWHFTQHKNRSTRLFGAVFMLSEVPKKYGLMENI